MKNLFKDKNLIAKEKQTMKEIQIFKHSKLIKVLKKEDLDWMTQSDLEDYYTFCKCTKVISIDENDEEKVVFSSDKPKTRTRNEHSYNKDNSSRNVDKVKNFKKNNEVKKNKTQIS